MFKLPCTDGVTIKKVMKKATTEAYWLKSTQMRKHIRVCVSRCEIINITYTKTVSGWNEEEGKIVKTLDRIGAGIGGVGSGGVY